jgi:hypothetical protein
MALSIIIGNPLSIILNHFSIQILNFDYIVLKLELNFECCHTLLFTPPRFTVGAATNTPACQQEALPARYRCTASLSTYTDRGAIFFAPLTSYAIFARFESEI